jgi:lysophospholipase L1-like esterase
MSIKEKKAYPETGWGMPFEFFWDSSITVINKAKNGRSTKTFIQEGIWKNIVDSLQSGDYVFIQFGHNDESPEKVDRYTSPDSFRTNLQFFIQQVTQKGGIPILLTPVSRRKFDKNGTALATHEKYTPLVLEVAQQMNTYCIDLDSASRNLYQQMGADNSRLLFLQLQPGEHPNYPSGKEDNTHFNELGARLIAQIVLADIKKNIPALAQRIVTPTEKK